MYEFIVGIVKVMMVSLLFIEGAIVLKWFIHLIEDERKGCYFEILIVGVIVLIFSISIVGLLSEAHIKPHVQCIKGKLK